MITTVKVKQIPATILRYHRLNRQGLADATFPPNTAHFQITEEDRLQSPLFSQDVVQLWLLYREPSPLPAASEPEEQS